MCAECSTHLLVERMSLVVVDDINECLEDGRSQYVEPK